MPLDQREALDSIDHFIRVGKEMATLPPLAEPEYRPAAEDLFQIAKKLMTSNETMARWLNRFLHFDFRPPDARGKFDELAAEYTTAKSGPGFHEMKFNCGDIRVIYDRNIDAKLPEMFPQDRQAADAARAAFLELGHADNDMVAFIFDTIVSGIDGFVARTTKHLQDGDVNVAESERLQFNVASADLSARLVRFASELADLVLTYAALAKRPVTLT